MKRFRNNNLIMYIVMAAIVVIFLSIMAVFNILLDQDQDESGKSTAGAASYSYHVAMISGVPSDEFWEKLYGEARKTGADLGIYAENFGADLNEDYSAAQLVKMAVAARVDGIIVEPDETDDMQEAFDLARENKIPVITLMDDAPESSRVSYIGVNDYTLGEMYGGEVLKAVEGNSARVAVLVPVNADENAPSYIYTGISESVAADQRDISISTVRTGEDREFVSEETVRRLLLSGEGRPDVLVCLNAVDTISAYQCVRDYNLVGKVRIIGYYTSREILEGIKSGVIQSTVAVDAAQAGQLAMAAMEEYLRQRYTSEYFPVSAELVNQENVGDYMKQESGE